MRLRNYKYFRVWVHVLVWVVFFTIMILPGMIGQPQSIVAYYAAHFSLLFFATYINIVILIKQFFHKEKYRQYIFWIIVLWLASVGGIYISAITLKQSGYPDKFIIHTAGAMVAFSMEFFLLTLYKAAKEWYLKSQRSKEIELAKVQAELSLLRSQLDSHFIFNTLNNLYLLVLNKSDKAPDALLKLSELLSYSVYESQEDSVPIAKELYFIENYIALQQLRLDDKQVVYYEVTGQKNMKLEPLILFNFIENAFKHAEGSVVVNGKNYYVYIHVDVQPSRLVLKTINGKSRPMHKITADANHKGVGMPNAVKRLDLAYENHYTLNIDDKDNEYHLELIIKEL